MVSLTSSRIHCLFFFLFNAYNPKKTAKDFGLLLSLLLQTHHFLSPLSLFPFLSLSITHTYVQGVLQTSAASCN